MIALNAGSIATVTPQRPHDGSVEHEPWTDAVAASLLRALQRLRLPSVSYCELSPIALTACDTAEVERLLCGSEHVELTRCRCSKRRTEFLAGRVAAKRAVARALGRTDPAEIEIVKLANGAPTVRQYPELGLSISHSGAFAVAIASNVPIGIDLERETQRPRALVDCFFHAREQRMLDAKRGSDWNALVDLLWTRKEAAAKVGHFGASLAFSQLDCSEPQVQVGSMAIRLQSVRSSGYVLSVAYEEQAGGSHG